MDTSHELLIKRVIREVLKSESHPRGATEDEIFLEVLRRVVERYPQQLELWMEAKMQAHFGSEQED